MQPAHPEGVTTQIISRLKELISSGQLCPGMKLPPERDLSAAFGVSRSSLRHALKALEVMGVVVQRVGDGTYLAAEPDAILREPFELLLLIDRNTLEDLLETRMIVEPELAARAAERATTADLDVLRRTLEVRPDVSQQEIIEADLRFHRGIFEAARNRICSRVFSLIHRSMSQSIDLTSHLVDWSHTLEFHRPIYQAIEKRNPSKARQAMLAHLTDARNLLNRVERSSRQLDLTVAIQPIAGTARGGKRRERS
jgi:GntR family transcriptional regulator, transcriptional repressor for pyruvate dehydrogenase complex